MNISHWENDNDVHNCRICNIRFTLITRKHHCRICGRIICNNCYLNCITSNSKNTIKTCKDCDIKLRKVYQNTPTQTDNFNKESIGCQTSICERSSIGCQTSINERSSIGCQTPRYESCSICCQTESLKEQNTPIKTVPKVIKAIKHIPSPEYQDIKTSPVAGKILKTPSQENITFNQEVKPPIRNESTKEAVLRRKREKKEREEQEYLLKLKINRDNYIDETRDIRKGCFFDTSDKN